MGAEESKEAGEEGAPPKHGHGHGHSHGHGHGHGKPPPVESPKAIPMSMRSGGDTD